MGYCQSQLKVFSCLSIFFIVIAVLTLSGCSGDDGAPGTPGTSRGIVAGTVTNSISSSAVEATDIETDPDTGAATQTDASGAYSITLPAGVYEITFSKTNFTSQTITVSVLAGETMTKDISLVPASGVVVNAGSNASGNPGDNISLSASIEILNGSTDIPTYAWTQTAGVTATIAGADTATPTITLGSGAAYKDAIFEHSRSFYGDDANGDPIFQNHDRFMVQPITPLALEEAELATFKLTVTIGSSTYSDTVDITADLPFAVNPGVRDVPINVPVLLHGKTQVSYNWSLTVPTGSVASLDDTAVQNPSFTPDISGKYTATESDSGNSVEIFAGTWTGVIEGIGADGRPDADGGCTGCHDGVTIVNGKIALDKFTPWRDSGHAEILTQNITDPAGHWTPSGCGPCHSVGYNPDAENDGFDDLAAAEKWTFEHGSPDAWTDMVAHFPGTARRANIQCENCHGPQNSGDVDVVHEQVAPRTDLASDVCGSCHGEPLRHARFQQWAESGHGNYELAIGEGFSGTPPAVRTTCAGCHTGQGFLQWYVQLQGDSGRLAGSRTLDAVSLANLASLTPDNVHPQTCAVCHDPHAQGTMSGEPNTATVRVEGNTSLLPAGFMANGVGRGAQCITCHNSRNGEFSSGSGNPTLHEDGDTNFGTFTGFTEVDPPTVPPTYRESYAEPHRAAQGDVLMGRNAYFFGSGQIGRRSKHSFIADTCTTCHMELTPPPAELSYNLSGTNHTFTPSLKICSDCHGNYDGGTIQEAFDASMEELNHEIALAVWRLAGSIPTDVVTEFVPGRTPKVVVNGASVNLEDYLATAFPPYGVSSDIAKAAWNFSLLEEDGSKGIHNPSFTFDVINATIARMKSL